MRNSTTLWETLETHARDADLFELIEAADMTFVQIRSLAVGIHSLLHSGSINDALTLVSMTVDRVDEGRVFLNDTRTLMTGGFDA